MARAYCSGMVAVLLFALGAGTSGQTPSGDARGYIVFFSGRAIGREDVTTTRTAQGVTISGHGRLGMPLDVITARAEVRYKADWTPESLEIEAMLRGKPVTLKTAFSGTDAVSEAVEEGRRMTETDKVSPQTVVVPNLFFGTYEALAQRLATAQPGTTLPAYVAPDAEIPVRVRAVRTERVQTGRSILTLRQYELTVANPGGDLIMQLAADDEGHLVRLTVPAQGLDVVREDVAAASARSLTHANPGDEPVTIPAYGFNIAGTITRAARSGTGKLPAVVLIGDSGTADRDGVTGGVPVVSQLAGALADAGFVTLRYDRRGFAQSGGRAEGATFEDIAGDARTVVKYLAGRKDVDSRRVAIVGHGEGGWVALLAASKDNRVRAVVTLGSAASTGADLVLEQQAGALAQMKVPDAERLAKIALQKQIHAAVLTGQGWDGVPRELKRAADTPWFQSLLQFDPARPMKNLDQPLLVLQGELDRQVPRSHADRLLELAKKRGEKKRAELVLVPGVNHLLVPAVTGEVAEYATLRDAQVSRDAATAVAAWLSRTMAAR